MSADNWGTCPKCVARQKAAIEASAIALKKSYGHVSVEVYEQKKEMHDSLTKARPEQELREDYEIWTDENGLFYVSYRCACYKVGCDFVFEFKQERKVFP